MLKNYRKYLTAGVLAFGLAACGDDVTITEPAPPPPPPETPNIVSFSVAPTNATIAVGQTVQASYNLQTKAGVAGAVAFTSANAAVASVDAATGLITAVSNGTALISATATAGGQTATAQIGITVRQVQAAQISIQSVTTGNTATPVALNNVMGQIEVNMNFNPGEQTVDSVNVFIGSRRAAKQSFVTNPAAGIITLSVNTANYAKNSTTGVATVDYQNGASTISAAVYPRGGAATATNTIAVVLNNTDGWAADMSTPTAFTNATSGPGAGLTYWGGPTAGGQTTVTVYPVIYTPGRSIASVNFGLDNLSGACNQTDTSLPFRTTFGASVSTPGTNCNQESLGSQNNVVINSSIDNTNNNGPTGFIVNTTVPGSIPNALRFDWRGPNSVTAPQFLGAHGFSWVNATWAFKLGGSPAPVLVTDLGVGPMASSYATFAGAAADTTLPTPVTTGADLAETNTNIEYRIRARATDLLANASVSSSVGPFGVDKTSPTIRYPTVATLASIRTYAANSDTITFGPAGAPLAPAAGSQWAVEAIDNRAGLFDQPNVGYTVRGVGQFVNKLAPGSPLQRNVALGANNVYATTLGDGYRQTDPIPVYGDSTGTGEFVPGYYTYTATIRDRAGNAVNLSNIADSTAAGQRRVAIDPAAPVAAGLTMPFTFGTNNVSLAATFQFSASDDLEVIDSRLGFNFPALTAAPFIFPGSIIPDLGVRWDGTLAGVTANAANLTTPVLGTLVAPDFWAGIQLLCGNGCVPADTDGGLGEPVFAAGTYQPASVQAQASDVFGTLSTATTSNVLPGSLNATTQLAANVYAAGNITANGIQVRYLSGTTVRQVSNFSVTLPQLARLHAFRLIAGEWVYQGTVQGSAGAGSDNGLERFWDYNFGAALTPAGDYAIVAMYNGPVTAARGTALMYVFTK